MSFAVVWVITEGGRFASRKIVYAAFLALACLLALTQVALHFPPSEEAQKNSATQSLLAHQTGGGFCSPP